jgi:hypothetical protein
MNTWSGKNKTHCQSLKAERHDAVTEMKTDTQSELMQIN